MYGPTGTQMPYSYYQYPQPNRQFPFLATLDLPDLSRLTNDPMYHIPNWPVIPMKLPSDIPKFDEKPGEDPKNHITTYHLWCSSNSLINRFIHLRLFQRTLTGTAAKWYIKLPTRSFKNFNTLEMAFLTHFQLPIHYETGTDLLTSLRQSNSTHISDHIHEWRWRQRLIKAPIPDQILIDWFTKSLLPPIARDVTMGGAITKEQAIACAQYLDLVYSQSGTLYDLIPHAPRPTTDPSQPSTKPSVDGLIGLINNQSESKSIGHSSAKNLTGQKTENPAQTKEVNVVQSSSPLGKNKNKGKKKQQKNPRNQNTTADENKCKVKYPCQICGEYHFTRDCSHWEEV